MSNTLICSALNSGEVLSVSNVKSPGVAESASLPSSDVENGEKEFWCDSIDAMDVRATLPGFHAYVTPSTILAPQSR